MFERQWCLIRGSSYPGLFFSSLCFYLFKYAADKPPSFLMFPILLIVCIPQIGIKAEWRGHHGRLVLFMGNKNTSPLTSVQALILPPAHLRLDLSPVPDTIPPRAQVLLWLICFQFYHTIGQFLLISAYFSKCCNFFHGHRYNLHLK